MPDDTYVLDLTVTGADQVTVNDDGQGSDTISVQGIYAKTVEISLCFSAIGGLTTTAGGYYYDQNGMGHRLVINGLIENAFGSIGHDFIQGNEFANRLFGDKSITGPGAADTIWGGLGADTVHGGFGADVIAGDADDDLLFGDIGADTIAGGTGRDTVEGGAGADRLDGGGSAGDLLSYKSSAAGIQVALTVATMAVGAGGDAEGDVIRGFLNVMGSAFRDIVSDADKSTLAAHGNDNAFFGGGGRDWLILGGGNDSGLGGAEADVIWGEVGDDLISGGNGNDVLRGGMGVDTLTGGAGVDRFEFRRPNDSPPDLAAQDIVTDFSAVQGDRIGLSAMDADTTLGGNQAFHLITTAFTGNPGALRLVVQGSDLMAMGDIDGDLQADFAILFLGISALTASDFVL